MHGFFVALGFGLVTAAILAFSAVAFSLQYGVSNHPNFAHGELLTIGAYAAYVSQTLTTNLVVGGAAAAVTGGLVAWGMNRGIVEPFVRAGARRGARIRQRGRGRATPCSDRIGPPQQRRS